MDVKIALGKIEQYWQIIRNLHFHIEQEGKISPEEYALIDKYLKVISQKYKELIEASPEISEITFTHAAKVADPVVQKAVEDVKIVEEAAPVIASVTAPIEINPPKPVEIPVAEVVQPVIKEETIELQPIEETEIEQAPVPVIEVIAPEIVAEAPKSKTISSYLEQMLDSPDNVPDRPIMFSNEKTEKKSPSLNDRLKEMKTPVEDLNSRIKKATAEKISLNDKFEFIRELFGNNPVEYANAIQLFDTYGTYAWEKVETEYAIKFNWASKPGSVEKLKNLVTGK